MASPFEHYRKSVTQELVSGGAAENMVSAPSTKYWILRTCVFQPTFHRPRARAWMHGINGERRRNNKSRNPDGEIAHDVR
jgi:hypothetical protein